MGQINKISIQFWITGYLDVTEQKRNSCSTYHSFNVFFSITTYNFITTGRQLKLASKYLPFVFSLPLHFYALLLQSYWNQVKEISKNLKNQARVYLAYIYCYFSKIPKWQHKLVRNYKRGKLVSYFLNNAARKCLYRPQYF